MAKITNDISSYQRSDLAYMKSLYRHGSRGITVKMTEGNWCLNPSASMQIYNALKVFGSVSTYHYLDGYSLADAQARYFSNWMKAFHLDSSTVWALDVEDPSLPWNCDHMIDQFIDYMKSHGYPEGKVVYGSGSWFNEGRINKDVINTDNIWVAAYDTDEPGVDDTSVWQYTDDFSGLSTDGSLDFKGVFTHVSKPKSKPKKHVHIAHKLLKPKVKPKSTYKYWRHTGKYEVISSVDIYKDLYDKHSTQVDLDKGSTFYAAQVFTFHSGATRFKTDVGYITSDQKYVRPIK